MLLIFVVASGSRQVTPQSLPGGITGIVRLHDGKPIEGATVTAKTDCEEMSLNLVQEVKTSANGSFYVPPFTTGICNRIRLSAKKIADLWLETGHDVFYGADNGTAPVVEIPSSKPTEIRLGDRGGSISFRVRDKATERFIWAELYIQPIPVPGKKFGSIQIATGRDGSPDTLLLPVGKYEVFVEQFSCGAADYFASNRPREEFSVEAGRVMSEDILVDVRDIRPAKSYANPNGKPCKL